MSVYARCDLQVFASVSFQFSTFNYYKMKRGTAILKYAKDVLGGKK